jgi:hypothetical protein
MRHLVDYALKIVLLFFIFARLVSGPSADNQAAAASPAHEPTSDSTT